MANNLIIEKSFLCKSVLTKIVITSKSVQLKKKSTPVKRHHLALRTGGPGQGTNAVDRRCQTWQDIDDERNDWSTWGSRRRWKAPNTRTARGGGPAPAYLHLKQGLDERYESCENVRNVKKGAKLHWMTTDARQLMTTFWWKLMAVWWQFVKKNLPEKHHGAELREQERPARGRGRWAGPLLQTCNEKHIFRPLNFHFFYGA